MVLCLPARVREKIGVVVGRLVLLQYCYGPFASGCLIVDVGERRRRGRKARA